MPLTSPGKRIVIFVLLCMAGAAVLAGYIRFVHLPREGPDDAAGVTTNPADLAAFKSRNHVVFVNTTFDNRNNHIALAPLDAPGGLRFVTPLRCERVHMGGQIGLCLTADRGVLTKYYGYVFDSSFGERSQFPLQGTPSRARVSPDGRFGAVTVFVSGDSYASNSFSTRTTVIDMTSGQPLGELEQFTAIQNGEPFRAADFNYWGVTFSREPGIFFATLSTAGHMWLVRGDVSRREVTTIFDGVECPSLSPDGTRIVFKKRENKNGRLGWRLEVLTLKTLTALPVAEDRSVDDQAEWLDRDHVLYSLPRPSGGTTVWTVPADGSGSPQLFLDNAYSPAIVR
jgi:WD40-like Beta Propeller Repeat